MTPKPSGEKKRPTGGAHVSLGSRCLSRGEATGATTGLVPDQPSSILPDPISGRCIPPALATSLTPTWGTRLSAIVRNHSTSTASAARRATSALFKWEMEEGVGDRESGHRHAASPPTRSRAMACRRDHELVRVWNACDGDNDFDKSSGC